MIDLQIATHHKPLPKSRQFITWTQAALLNLADNILITIRLVDNKESQTLNLEYRQQDKPTNVLAFPFMDTLEEALQHPHIQEAINATQAEEGHTYLGDLVINAPLVEHEAKEQNKPIMHHWAHMVIHGCLHLQGYDHIESDEAVKMETLEVALLSKLNIANPYVPYI